MLLDLRSLESGFPYAVDTTEAVAAADSVGTTLTAVVSLTETVISVDSETVALNATGFLTEPVSSSESETAILTAVTTLTESLAASDAVDATLVEATKPQGAGSSRRGPKYRRVTSRVTTVTPMRARKVALSLPQSWTNEVERNISPGEILLSEPQPGRATSETSEVFQRSIAANIVLNLPQSRLRLQGIVPLEVIEFDGVTLYLHNDLTISLHVEEGASVDITESGDIAIQQS